MTLYTPLRSVWVGMVSNSIAVDKMQALNQQRIDSTQDKIRYLLYPRICTDGSNSNLFPNAGQQQ